MRQHPNIINRFIHDVIDAFTPHPPYQEKEKTIMIRRDFNEVVAAMLEMDGTFIIRDQVWADGKVSYFLIQIIA